MLTAAQWAFYIAAIFLSAFLQATSGFGFALLAMPLVTLALGTGVALPLVAAEALLLFIANAVRLRRYVQWQQWWRLSLSGLAGIPFGFWLHTIAPEHVTRALLGSLLIAYAAYSFIRKLPRPQVDEHWVYLAGLLAGVLGGGYNIPGPPVVVYADLKAWSRDEYRATLQAFFVLTGLLVVAGHVWAGHVDRQVGSVFVASLPALVLGNIAGALSERFVDSQRFRQIVLGLLVVTGLALLF
jgi:uncharacterized membrane protein YfcA